MDKVKKHISDVTYALAKSTLAQVPILGGPATELLALIIVPPYEKRRTEWFNNLAEDVAELAEKVEGFNIEELSQNESFITTVTHASQAAIRNHQKEKLDALRNAVLNAALPNSPEEDLQLVFLNFIDSATPWHLIILKYFNNPVEWGKKHGVNFPNIPVGSLSSGLELAFPELQGKRETYNLFAKDLFNRGLLGTDSLHTSLSEGAIFASQTTSLGKQFLDFISSPLETD